jgi:endonuclease/exonuclease/phosphatase family metal-dependent hydrolase
VATLIRSWNIFHGRSDPPDWTLSVETAVRLAVSDHPTILCLQELPTWSLGRLEAWTGMTAVTAVTVQASIGPIPIPADLGRRLVELHPVRLRSAFCGQGNAVLVSREARVLETRSIVLNSRDFRREHAPRLGLDLVARLAWAKERRICQAVRLLLPDGRRALVANFHASSMAWDERVPDAEVMRAARFAHSLSDPGEIVVLAGDYNVTPRRSPTIRALTGPEWGFSPPGPGIDHVLVRGAEASEHHAWPSHRRRVDGRVLSDHAPVEITLT